MASVVIARVFARTPPTVCVHKGRYFDDGGPWISQSVVRCPTAKYQRGAENYHYGVSVFIVDRHVTPKVFGDDAVYLPKMTTAQ